MSDFSYQYLSNCKNPKKRIIFLHGYNNTYEEMSHIYEKLLSTTKNLGIFIPIGKQTATSDINRHSWWKISGFDSEGKRLKQETPIEEIVYVYNQVGNILYNTSKEVNDFIDKLQQKYNFTDNQTYIAGFSQGAMLGIWTALTRKNTIRACFSFSGLVAADNLLTGKIVSKPKVYLLHGKQDKQVLYKCMDYNLKTLQNLKIETDAISFENLDHKVSLEEIDFMVSKI